MDYVERLVNATAGSTITEFYNSTGDWIVNESNQSTEFASGEAVIGYSVNQGFTAAQTVMAVNARDDSSSPLTLHQKQFQQIDR